MTATDELKMLLEQRGERYVENDFGITWRYLSDPHTATESMDGTLIVTGLTPEQAIAATLGAGTCHVESSIIDTYEYNRWEYELSCGHTIIWEDSEPPRFCPDCGRRVE